MMETHFIPENEFVAFIKANRPKCELVAIDGKNRWVMDFNGTKKIVRPIV